MLLMNAVEKMSLGRWGKLDRGPLIFPSNDLDYAVHRYFVK